jgi:hypothetical protein
VFSLVKATPQEARGPQMRDERWRRWRLFENQPASERTASPVVDTIQTEARLDPSPAALRVSSAAASGALAEEIMRC